MIMKFDINLFDTYKSNELLPLECEYCGKIFYASKRMIKFEIVHKRGRLKFCSTTCSHSAQQKKHLMHCRHCGKEIEVLHHVYEKSETKNFFCSNVCSAKFNNKMRTKPTQETKKKISDSLRKTLAQKSFTKQKLRTCKVCGKQYYYKPHTMCTKVVCSRECSHELKVHRKKYLSDKTRQALSLAGRKSANLQKENHRSKNEIYFCSLCENYFNDVKHNDNIFNGWDADIIIEDKKIAVLWNGIWHYKKIHEHHSLEQVQNRDRIKIQEVINYGYTPYVIKDMGKYNPSFVQEEFEKFKKFINENFEK